MGNELIKRVAPSNGSIKHVSNESAFLRMHHLIVALLQLAEDQGIPDVHGGHLVEGYHLVLYVPNRHDRGESHSQ